MSHRGVPACITACPTRKCLEASTGMHGLNEMLSKYLGFTIIPS